MCGPSLLSLKAPDYLGPARSGGNTVGLSTGGDALGVAVEGSGGLDQMRVGERSLAHSSEALSGGGTLAGALVGGEVE